MQPDGATPVRDTSGPLLRSFLAQMANVAANILTSLVLTRIIVGQLGLVPYGFFNTALNIALLFGVLADLGFSILTVREMNRAPERADETFARLTMTRLFAGACVVLAASVTSRLLGYPDVVRDGVLLLTLSAVVSGMTLQFGAYFQARLEAAKLAWSLLAGVLMRFALAAFLILAWGTPLRSVFFSYLIGALIGLAVSVWLARGALPAFRLSSLRFFGFRPAFVLGLFAVLGVVHFRVDVLLLSLLRSPADVGAYGIAVRVYEAFLAVYLAFAAAFYPVMARAFRRNDETEARRLLQNSFDGLSGISFGIVPLGMIGAPLAILLLSGSPVAASVDVLRVLVFGLPAIFASIFGLVLILLGHERLMVALLSGAVVLNVLLNLLLIPAGGAVGAAVATVGSELFSVGSAFVLCARVLSWRPSFRKVSRYAAASTLTLAVLLGGTALAGNHALDVVGLLLAGALSYALLCLALGAISWDAASGVLRRLLPAEVYQRRSR